MPLEKTIPYIWLYNLRWKTDAIHLIAQLTLKKLMPHIWLYNLR
jgi:hypothetical protein